MSTKPKTSAPPSASGNAAPADEPNFRTNPEVDAKIDAHIKENPKYWNYIQAMPRDRLERTVVLNEVRELDRQHRMREGMMKRINANPALKNAYETLVKDLPEDQKEGVIAQICPHRAAGCRPHPRPAATKAGRCWGLNRPAVCHSRRRTRKPVAPAGFRAFFPNGNTFTWQFYRMYSLVAICIHYVIIAPWQKTTRKKC